MPFFEKLSAAKKDRYCQQIYTHYISATADTLVSCEEIAEILRAYIPSGCYTNFRDTLFHFRCLMHAENESVVLSQIASIIEHANRAVRDAKVAICIKCITIFHVLASKYPLEDAVARKVDLQIRALQDFTLKLRLGSMMLDGMELLYPSDEDFFDMMDSYLACANTYVQEEFKNVVSYARELEKQFSAHMQEAFSSSSTELRDFKAFSTYNDVAELVYAAIFES